jgi:hypothetical protein
MSAVEYVVGLMTAVLLAAIGELVSDEIRARLDRIPLALLALAARRLPPEQHKPLKGYSVNRTSRKILVRPAAMATASSGPFSSGPLK